MGEEDTVGEEASVVASTLAVRFEAGSEAEAGLAIHTRSREVPPRP